MGAAMHRYIALNSMMAGVFGTLALGVGVQAQEGGPAAPWRGAGERPCFGSDGGSYRCSPPDRLVAIRAGRLFDSEAAQLLPAQVVLIKGDRIIEVAAAAQAKIPSEAEVIDLGGAT